MTFLRRARQLRHPVRVRTMEVFLGRGGAGLYILESVALELLSLNDSNPWIMRISIALEALKDT